MAINVGDRIGDYEVTGTLGAGGMGQVYQVRHTISHRIEAMKVLLPGRPDAEEIAERFLREIRLLASLDHPNIAALHTAFRHQGELVMIMEFVEGQTIRPQHNGGGIMVERSLDYIKQVLSGLAYAHDRGIIHRDIKPSNIMLSGKNQVKLLDFGLALPALGPEYTRSGTRLGSLHYMSPEQVLGKKLDARSDIYSTGVTLYQLITARLPFEGDGEYAIATGHLKSRPEDPRAMNPSISSRLSQIVLKSLAKSPDDRFQTAHEFRTAFDAFPSDATTLLVPLPHSGNLNQQAPVYPESPRPSSTPQVPAAGSVTDTNVLSAISRDLASHIGPISKVVVLRAAKQAATLDELYALLAPEIDSEEKRKVFLATRHKHSSFSL
ncbi:MAG TPA: serine/threonine-protein kinase [Acidobacteriaceae bacterium]|nr:serine/threonine-protein kinase [Acidobacteriaceae bacterium]